MEKLIELAKKLDNQFKEDNYDVYNFHNLAAKALEEVNEDDISIDKIIDVLDRGPFSQQFIIDDKFGEPSITIYKSEEIVLDILMWTSSDTNIHSHGFTGAFRTMKGETIQAIYKTKNTFKAPYEEMIEDEVTLKELKFLRVGAIQKIPSGISFMHKSYHVEIPTINLLFRTIGLREHELGLIQHSVKPPNILYKNFIIGQLLSKRVSLVNALIKLKDKRAPELLKSFVKSLSDSDLVGIKLHGVGNIHFTGKSKTIMFTEILNELKERGLYEKFNNFKSDSLIISRIDKMKPFDKLGCMVESLMDCKLTLKEMEKFLKDNKILDNNGLLVDTVAHIISTYNDLNLLRISINEVALDILKLMLKGYNNENITKVICEEYDAPIETIEKDVERISVEILEKSKISFLF